MVEVNNSEGDIGEEEEEKEEEAEEEEEEARLVRYWVKVMRLFEQVPAPTLVIAVAKVATDVADPRNPENVRTFVSPNTHVAQAYMHMSYTCI